MYLPHLFLKLLGVDWKASNLDKSLKQTSTVARIFMKVSETNRNSRKICESKNMRESVPLLVSDFLLFKVFVSKFNKKAQSPNVPNFGVLSPVSWAPVYWVLSPGSRVLDPKP